jgi:hypothetical protein
MNSPRKPLWPKIVATVVALLPMLYVVSFGPACWLASRGFINRFRVADAYEPLVHWSGYDLTNESSAALRWYATALANDRSDGALNMMQVYVWLKNHPFVRREVFGYDEKCWEEYRTSPLIPAK